MNESTVWDSDIADLQGRINSDGERLRELECMRAVFLCPVKFGDIVQESRTLKKAVVTRVTRSPWRDYAIYGRLIKKDGTLSHVVRELWQFEKKSIGTYEGEL